MMKRALTAAALALSLVAWADDSYTTEKKEEVKSGKDKTVMKSESKTTSDPDGLMNSTTDKVNREEATEKTRTGSVSTSEKTVTHDAPGMKNDAKKSVKRKVVRDQTGTVTQDETTVK